MATDQQSGSAVSEMLKGTAPVKPGAQQIPAGTTSLAQLPAEIPELRKDEERYALLKGIPIEVDVAIPVRRFQVRNVLALAVGQVIATRWPEGEDVPLAAHGTQLAWTEIEVIDQKLAVRLTRLA